MPRVIAAAATGRGGRLTHVIRRTLMLWIVRGG
jgi:hypothetical protein